MERITRFIPGKTTGLINRCLRFIVRSAYENTACYRRAWDKAGVSPDDIRTVDDLPRLPFMTKNDVLDSQGRSYLHAGMNPEKGYRTSTSGSTLRPLTVFTTWPETYFRRIMLIKAIGQNIRLRFPLTFVDVGTAGWHKRRDAVQKVGLIRIVRVPRDIPPEEQPKILTGVKSLFIQGRPSCLEILAREIKGTSALIQGPGLIVSYGETLHSDVRAVLSDVFECPVTDYYNCEEIGNIAWQCPVRNDIMHINTDACIVEVVDDRGRPVSAGTEGRLLLTSLYNIKMPFIRYVIGDRGVFVEDNCQPCGCGQKGPRMSLVSGREEDFFVTPDGRMISPRVTVQPVLDAIREGGVPNLLSEALRGFQVVQEDLRNITVRVIPGRTFDPSLKTSIDAGFKAVCRDWKCRLEIVSELPQESTGKFRKTVNLLPRNKRLLAKI